MGFGDIWDSPVANLAKRVGQGLASGGASEIFRQAPQEPIEQFINQGIGAPLGWGLGLNDLSAADAFGYWVPPVGEAPQGFSPRGFFEKVADQAQGFMGQASDAWDSSNVDGITDSELAAMGITDPKEQFAWRVDFVTDYHGMERIPRKDMPDEGDGPDGPDGPGTPRGPSLDDLLAQQQQIIRDMVARGMMGVDEAEAAYTQAVSGIYADFQNEQNITRTGFDADVEARGTQRAQDRQDSMDALIAAGVDPRGSSGDQLASDQAYNAGTDAQSEYMDALMRISEMGEGSRQLAGEREFGASRRSLNETQAQGFAGLESQAAMARALSGVSGTSPADLFAGMLSGMDTVGMQRQKDSAAAGAAQDQQLKDLAVNLSSGPNAIFASPGEAYAVLTGRLKQNSGSQQSFNLNDYIDEYYASNPGLFSEGLESISNLINVDGLPPDLAMFGYMDQFDVQGQ